MRITGVSSDGRSAQVVNALLTQLDKLKNRKNVLVVTTSNLSHAIGERPLYLFVSRILLTGESDSQTLPSSIERI